MPSSVVASLVVRFRTSVGMHCCGRRTFARPSFRRSASNAPRIDPLDVLQRRGPQLREFLNEAATVISRNGAKGIRRSIQAATSTGTVFSEYLSTGATDPPQVLLRKLFESLGATYIKLGQFIASSPTLFPDVYVQEFQKCLDATTPIDYSIIRRRIRSELNVPMDSVFSSVDPVPIASASIAQVHAAKLKSDGRDVVIKVLKPGVEDVLDTDLSFLYLSVKLLEILNPEILRMSLTEILSDIRRTIEEEVDFRKEAEHIDHFQFYLERNGLTSVAKAPYVYRQFSSKRVLTMERLNGAALVDLEAVKRMTSADPESVLISALNVWIGSLIGAETFHADVHAGNLLVLPDGKVGFIDFGIVGRIAPITWKAAEAFFVSVGREDFSTMAKALATMGATSEDVDLIGLERDLRELFREFQGLDAGVMITTSPEERRVQAELLANDEQVNALLLKIVRTGETHGLRFPREFGLLLKQLLYFDRYVKILAPALEIVRDRRVQLGDIDIK